MIIKTDVANILGNSEIVGNRLYLPPEKLERKVYLAVNKTLEAVGGKWNRKYKAHVFLDSPEEIIEEILLAEEYTDSKKEYQFFETPEHIAKQLVEMAGIKYNDKVLEPSAGRGAIARYIPYCDCVELNPDNRQYLLDTGFNVRGEDFLTYDEKYNVIVANPPFTKQQDIDHVNHMLDLAPRVVSIMSSSVMFRTNKKTEQFRDKITKLNGKFIKLPEKSFKESGTNVNTCIVYVDKS